MNAEMLNFTLSYLSTGLILLFLAVFAYARDRQSRLNIRFALYSLSIGWWSVFSVLMINAPSAQAANFWDKTCLFGAIFIPSTFIHFILTFVGRDEKYANILKVNYGVSLVFLTSLLATPYFVESIEPKGSIRYFTHPGFMYTVFVAYFVLLSFAGIFQLFTAMRKESENTFRKQQLAYLFWASLFGYVGGTFNYMLVYNAANSYIAAMGNYLIAIYGMAVAYIILRYRFLNIEVIIKKTLVFTGLFASAYGMFAVFMFLGQVVFERITGGNRWASLIPSIVIIVLVLRPLENFLLRVTDKYLFQKRYDYKQLLKTFTGEVLTVLDLDNLVNLTANKLSGIMKLASCGVLLLDRERNAYALAASQGINDKNIELDADGTLPGFLKRTKTYLSIQAQGDDSKIPMPILEDMNKLKLELAIPLILHNDMIGILTLGKKKSDEDYEKDDIDILLTLARTLAIAVSNAELFAELSKTQAEAAQREKMAVIGTLSAGINHEICNPLGIARGQCEAFILNMRDGLYKDKTQEELLAKAREIMEKVIKETDRATVITKKLSSFAKPSKGIISDEVDVKKEIDEVLSLIGYELKLEKISLAQEIPPGLARISADKKQVQEIFFNLLRNAAQAISERGVITVRAREESDRVIVEIEDTGHGIPQDKLGEIFNPFYTTKEPGKGTGLGLFIVRQIVERNKGRISVKSRVGEGTTFTLEFPVSVRTKV